MVAALNLWRRSPTLTIFAAASLENALDDAAKSYETSTGNKVVISYAAFIRRSHTALPPISLFRPISTG